MKELLEGDIHMANARAAGLDKLANGRVLSKTMIYCFLYWGGPEKLGALVGGGRKEGLALRKRFLSKTPALKLLRERVLEKAKRKRYLRAIDGRRVPIRHTHAALNTLLQSAGAILVKNATCNLYTNLQKQGLKLGEDFSFVGHVHDELQIEVREGIDDFVGEQAVKAIRESGEAYGFKCPLDAQYKSGHNWSQTH
jgi:DNA polymerase I-like protein with 3'-5' exonuclease and polymerase domains